MWDLLEVHVLHVQLLILTVINAQQLMFVSLAKIVIIYTQICVMQIA